jgi:hypothetical protein
VKPSVCKAGSPAAVILSEDTNVAESKDLVVKVFEGSYEPEKHGLLGANG